MRLKFTCIPAMQMENQVKFLDPQNISKAWKTEVNGDIKKQNVKWLNIAHPA